MRRSFWISIIFVSIGFWLLCSGLPNMKSAESAPLPEYYGTYAVDGDKLFEVTKAATQKAFAFHPDVYFIIFGSPQQLMGMPVHTWTQLGKQSYVRNEIALETPIGSDPRVDWPKHIKSVSPFNKWAIPDPMGLDSCSDPSSEAFKSFCVELRAKPVPSKPQMTQCIPREPLTPGVYSFNVLDDGWAWFFIGDKAQIEEYARKTCVDRYVYSGTRALIFNKPCSELDRYKPAAPGKIKDN